jgi:hypothetical protein
MSIDDYFASALPHERPVYDAVLGYVSTLGPIHVEPVNVGVFIKKGGRFLELRPMSRWVAMWFPLGRRVRHARIVRTPIESGLWVHHVANLRNPDDLDHDLRELLAESYDLVD